jgi:hypothetical protein
MNALEWAPRGFAPWLFDRNKSPGMVRLRENKTCAHEVAAELIEEKRQELKHGTSQRDLLSLLGSSCVSFMRLGTWCNVQLPSQGKFGPTTRLATERRRNCRSSSVRRYPRLFVHITPVHPWRSTIMFAGHESTAKTVSPFKDFSSQSI